jgi:hypothetical protein
MDDSIDRLVTLEDNDTQTPEQGGAADWLTGAEGKVTDGYTPESLEDVLGQQPHGAQHSPTPEDMESTNASNAEARAKAIADGLDEGTANIIYPDFSTPEDMNRIN